MATRLFMQAGTGEWEEQCAIGTRREEKENLRADREADREICDMM